MTDRGWGPTRSAASAFLASLMLLSPAAASAQATGSGPTTRLGISAPLPKSSGTGGNVMAIHPADDDEKYGTHWLRGGIIGGLILGTGMSLFLGEMSEYSEQPGSKYHLGAFVAFGTIGFLGGMLIGGQFKK